ncbi:hypothetical protein ENC19_28875 [Verrucosispora sp. CWR15]|uniref:Uncharacterized protein n=1 Tax=Verrucosispora sioxanthis TaxID=2499994 RepID=A0A6M1LDH5_9ACTN|nr:hypothetical protein [Verrucosispora sioxanthis]NEE67240.1 hypothetical protein [Verrucosispora sioxanthis]NGM16350.1 hypothetical protein [Verrucosispora sioxanthis]
MSGDESGAARALRRGLAVLDRHRTSLGATELRAHSGAYGQELAAEGLDVAVRAGAPARVLAWSERWRANTLRMRSALPPDDPELVATLAELRMVSGLLEDAVLADRPVRALRGRQADSNTASATLPGGCPAGARWSPRPPWTPWPSGSARACWSNWWRTAIGSGRCWSATVGSACTTSARSPRRRSWSDGTGSGYAD